MGDELADALRRYDEVVGEYVDVHQRIHDGLPPARRRRRGSILYVLFVLLLVSSTAMFTGGGRRFHAPPPVVSGWPNSANTGPTGTLTTYPGATGNPPECVISTPNTVIANALFNCTVVIITSGVQISNSRVNGQVWADVDNDSARSFTLTDVEVNAGLVQAAAVGLGNFVITRTEVTGGATSVQCSSNSTYCTMSDSYLHGQEIQAGSDWHLGGFLQSGGNGVTLTHNYVVCDTPVTTGGGGCSGDINFFGDFAVVSNVLVQHNLLGSNIDGSFCTYGGSVQSKPFPNGNNIRYIDNVFQRGTNGLCGTFGPVSSFDVNGVGNQWTNNTWENDGTAVPPSL